MLPKHQSAPDDFVLIQTSNQTLNMVPGVKHKVGLIMEDICMHGEMMD